ncbi:MAG: efflux RND transporter permease subunit [Nitrospira sp.]|nr:efflux RND transporter permease subunit [Nitrospira sp.]
MIDALIAFSLRRWPLIVILTGLLAATGVVAFRELPIDAFPDVTNIQVQILTEGPGLSPIEVERFVTIPLELQMTGLPDLTEIRSLSKFALSQITVVFKDHVDLLRARQLVLERLLEAKAMLPPGVEPVMAPVTTGLGEIYQYYLDSPSVNAENPEALEAALTDQRILQDWVLRPLIKSVPGVIDVNALGGFVKQYQVIVEPAKLRKYNLTLDQVFEAVAQNNANAGGNVVDRHGERAIVRGLGLVRSLADIEDIVVNEIGGTPVYVHNLGEVRIGHAIRHGAAVLNGEREVVVGIVLMYRGANARQVVEAVKTKVEAIHRSGILPGGLKLVPFYDRSELVTAALDTVRQALLGGIVLVGLVLFATIGNVRSALIVTATLILTPLLTFRVMKDLDLSANLMSLGGLAIAIGMVVDGSIVVVENVYRRLSASNGSPDSRWDVVLQASKEVARPIAFALLIIITVFLPLVTLEGMEGKLFAPLGYTVIIALVVSLVLCLTLSPVLCALGLRGGNQREMPIVRWAKAGYEPLLQWALVHRRLVLISALLLLGLTLLLVPYLGKQFVPVLEEGALTPLIIRLPRVSLPESIELEKRALLALREFPEVRLAVGKIGRSEIGNEPQEANESDPVVLLHPQDTWTTARTKAELVETMRRRLADIPGMSFMMSQPIQQRVDELISGVRTEFAIKLFGEDLDVLKDKADQIAAIMRTVEGVKDLRVEQIAGQPYLTVDIDRHKIARFGINVADIRAIIETAIGGKPATTVYENERRFELTLRFPEEHRSTVRQISEILVNSAVGAPIPLSELATVEMREGPARISREQVRRRIFIGFNVVGRDPGSIVEEGQRKLGERLHLPSGYTIAWGGAFEQMERAMAHLRIVVPIMIGMIGLLLALTFNSLRSASLIVANLPFALIGGVFGLWVTGQYLSVPASVGFIALFGVAVENGIVLVSTINGMRQAGFTSEDAIRQGCLQRLRPVMMTTLTTLLGLAPLALAQGIGSEVQRPLAVVVIGGLVSSTLLTLIVLPALYQWFEKSDRSEQAMP